MARDTRTEAIFTTADDQMQGLWGFHRYVKAATDIVEPDALLDRLPAKMFQLTHEWVRYYDPKEMAAAVSQMHEVLLCRQSLLTLVAVGEAALLRLNEHLVKTKGFAKVSKNKKLLEWAFSLVQKSSMASPEATARLPVTCGDLDNARRLRNCIVHSNSRYDDQYLSATIQNGWVAPQHERDPQRAVKAREPILLGTARFEYFLHSHIEFLHILHNTVQQQEFGHPLYGRSNLKRHVVVVPFVETFAGLVDLCVAFFSRHRADETIASHSRLRTVIHNALLYAVFGICTLGLRPYISMMSQNSQLYGHPREYWMAIEQ